MSEALGLILKLLVVKEIQKKDAGSAIIFQEGQSGSLPSSIKDYDYLLKLAYRSLERQHPVAVSLNKQGQITEMARADNDFPTQFIDNDKERMKVVFQGHDGTFFLRKDHPDFKKLSDVFHQAIKEKYRVWFVAQKPQLSLIDVIRIEIKPVEKKN